MSDFMADQKAPRHGDANAKIRKVIQRRIGQRRRKLRLTEKQLAKELGVDDITIKRWEGAAAPESVPNLSQARVLADRFGVSLDWLTGAQSDATADASSLAAWGEREREAVRARLDQLVADLMSARAALVRETRVEQTTDHIVGKSGSKKHGKTITVPGDAGQ